MFLVFLLNININLFYYRQFKVIQLHLLVVHLVVLQQQKVEIIIIVIVVEIVVILQDFQEDLQDILVIQQQKQLLHQKLILVAVGDTEMVDAVIVDNI